MKINTKNGFIQIPILLSIIFGVIALGSTSYIVVQKYQSGGDEKLTEPKTKDDELSKLKEEIELLKTNQSLTDQKQVSITKPVEVKKAVITPIVTAKEEVIVEPVKVVEPIVVGVPNSEFTIERVTQSIFKKTGYYSYGGYEVSLVIVANDSDIYIPKTTSDSTSGVTGFIYSILGDDFRGRQSSQVECANYEANYCWIKKGKTMTITTTVWLTPNESGNYSVKFDTMNFRRGANGKLESFNIDKETQKIYIN